MGRGIGYGRRLRRLRVRIGTGRCDSARHAAIALCVGALLLSVPVRAQDKGTLHPEPLPPLAKPDDPHAPAPELFGRKAQPAALESHTIGFYSKGCLAGGVALPLTGTTWQVMRVSRNRNWGHPNLVRFLERLANAAPKTGWSGLLVGDMSQPRGGPMRTGHASHQVGLDADIWLTPMPHRELSPQEREEMMATVVVTEDGKDVDRNLWTPAHVALIKAAAEDSDVARIFVNPAIKKALCRDAGQDRGWLRKVQPWWGHDYHFHVRLNCPAEDRECKPQPPRPAADGCGKELDHWFTGKVQHTSAHFGPSRVRTGPKLSELPAACRQVLQAPDSDRVSAIGNQQTKSNH